MSDPCPWTGSNFTKTKHSKVPSKLDPSTQTLPRPFVVCITGASRGIGAATARAFTQAGASALILTARSLSSLDETRSACLALASPESKLRISLVSGDASAESTAQALASTIALEHDGRLDVLINNAGVVGSDASAFAAPHEIGSDQFRLAMEVNYFGRFYAFKHLLPALLAGPTRAVVNISSSGSHQAAEPAMAYNISELANNRFAEAVAEAYGRRDGLVCFAVHPGHVVTTPPKGMPEAIIENFCNDDPGLCGAFLVWLVRERREWLSGRYLSANWDTDELIEKKEAILRDDKLKMRMVV